MLCGVAKALRCMIACSRLRYSLLTDDRTDSFVLQQQLDSRRMPWCELEASACRQVQHSNICSSPGCLQILW